MARHHGTRPLDNLSIINNYRLSIKHVRRTHAVARDLARTGSVNLVILEERDLAGASEATLTAARADHLLRVLKVAPGDTVRVGVLDGPLGVGTVESTAEGRVTL